jgi:spore photoproduct lyase
MAITQLYIDKGLEKNRTAVEFSRRLGLVPEIIEDRSELFNTLKAGHDPQSRGKQVLLLTSNKGAFIKQCPGTRDYLCCGYQILHFGAYCTMDCSYCILQSYFHPPLLHYFVNHDDLMTELDLKLALPEIQRIGTGEFTDSLIWEAWSDLTTQLIQCFAGQDRAVLELKTKTTTIAHLKDLVSNRKTIVGWSLNTPHIIATQERGTTSLKARLKAAAQCQAWGYPLAFHFDPMVIYPGCEEAYRSVVEMLFQYVSADNVVWISLGTMRFMPDLKNIIQQRFPQSDIIYGEFITGLDGKMRYFKPLRIGLYSRMVQWIRELAPSVTTYLCMEDEPVWEQSHGFLPESKGGLSAMLDEAARTHCHLT